MHLHPSSNPQNLKDQVYWLRVREKHKISSNDLLFRSQVGRCTQKNCNFDIHHVLACLQIQTINSNELQASTGTSQVELTSLIVLLARQSLFGTYLK
jgi:hypothetical protein